MASELMLAMMITEVAYVKDVDKAGVNYYHGHLTRVAQRLVHPKLKVIAYLHDVIEDRKFSLAQLYAYGFELDTVHAVHVLTRSPAETYLDYIRRIRDSDCHEARLVKFADLEDHLADTSCISETLIKRYKKAKGILRLGQIREECANGKAD